MYDIEAAEKQMRKDVALAGAQGIEMIQQGNADPEFLRAQRMFDEARIQFALAWMKLENDGMNRNAAISGAGHAIGAIWSAALQSCVGERERAILNGWTRQSLATALNLNPNDRLLVSIFGAKDEPQPSVQ